MVCPKCGEVNSDNFRFCGLCGTVLETRQETRRPTGAPASGPPAPAAPRMVNALEPMRSPVPPISGPSMLGLNHPGAEQPSANQPRVNQPRFNQNSFHQPSMDSLRETAFSGLDSFFEPEQPRTGGRRILLLVVLLAALGGAGWWTYTNYLGVTESRKPQAATSSADEAPAEKASEKPTPTAKDAAPVRDRGSSQAVVSAKAPESQPNSASADSDTAGKTVEAEVKPPPAVPVPGPKIVTPGKSPSKPEPGVTSAKAPTPPPPAAADTGDAAFRKGEAYLYGRGVPENCDEAVKYLKAASAKSNAKSRSAFGTMYATGHCVPRDLPTSYLWFALALRVDPNNQILEKDLSAVWNQMTPPERQMATRMKQ
ncbi:MAG TPA: zinc-ribbon domain-containing protein [Terriglobales bacterium]|nr:zinc-ribbon domain-containing protein [Terriglobales bacterium]